MDIESYIGKAWVSAEYDCWGLVREVYQKELGVTLPAFMCDATNKCEVVDSFKYAIPRLSPYFRSGDAKNYSIVLIQRFDEICHVGVWYEGRILHNALNVGVCWERDISPYSVQGCYEYINE